MQEPLSEAAKISATLFTNVDGERLILQLLVIGLAGAFGGLVYGIVTLLESGKTEKAGIWSWEITKGAPLGWYLWGQMAIGAGGAFAAVFAILTAGHVAHSGTADDFSASPVYWIALCVVGGFVGNRLLTGVGLNLAKQLTNVENKAERAVTLASEANRDSADAARRSDMMLDVVIARDLVMAMERHHAEKRDIPEDLRTRAEEYLKKLSSYAKSFPIERILNIVLANLKFELGRKQEAVDQLRIYLAARRKAKVLENTDDAAAHFNLACFFVSLGKDEHSAQHMTEALKALSECLRVAKSLGNKALELHVAKAQNDDDLEELRQAKEYIALLALLDIPNK
jgi:hypothetical protein